MSTRKSTAAVEAKVESVTTTKEKDITINIEIINEETDNTTTTTTNQTKTDSDSATQKMGNNTSNNNRVTRNSPLLLASPTTIKKELFGNESEPTNSESEDNCSNASASKKPIRGRKSIKDNNKEIATKEASTKKVIKEEVSSKITDQGSKDLKEIKNQATSKDNCEKEKEKDNNTEKDCKANLAEQNESKDNDEKECKEKDEKDLKENKNKDTNKTTTTTTSTTNLKETNNKDKDSKETKDLKEETTDVKESKESIDTKDIKDTKDSKDTNRESKDIKTNKESKDEKETKDSKETKDTKSSKDSKDTKDPKEFISNRLTRHAFAQDIASKTRMTRNRQASAGASSRPGTPPVTARRSRGGANVRKTISDTLASQKRKRSIEGHTDTPASKIIKLEPKDPEDESESSEQIGCGNIDLSSVKIKQELIESDDASSTIAEGSLNAITTASTSTTTATTTASSGRGRGNRWAGRKPTQTASPTTRSTRQNKTASPASSISSTSSNAPETKRRRTTGGNTIRRSTSSSTLKAAPQAANNSTVPDEDSKDSMTSLIDDILLSDIKMENLIPELDDNNDIDMESKKSTEEDDKTEETATLITNGIVEPLSIETEGASTPVVEVQKTTTNIEATLATSSANISTKKDASLSPDLVSEGVSEISVKQFYKRPQFLENNLGIEEDPKLGEIVQKVTVEYDGSGASKAAPPENNDESNAVETPNTENANQTNEANVVETATISNDEPTALNESFSAESLKEGELVYEESNDGKTPPSTEADAESSFVNVSSIGDDAISCAEEPLVVAVVEKNENTITKDEETESLQERLLLDEDDDIEGDEDDMTAEESETISMDNNPSLQDDDDEQDSVSNQANTIFEEIDELAQDGGLIDEIINDETKKQQTTSNECDIEKAKLPKEKSLIKENKIIEKNAIEASKDIESKQKIENIENSEKLKNEQEINETTEIVLKPTKKVDEQQNKNAKIVEEKSIEVEVLKAEKDALAKANKQALEAKLDLNTLSKLPEIEISLETVVATEQVEPMEEDILPKTEGDEHVEMKSVQVEKIEVSKEKETTSSRPTTPKEEEKTKNENNNANSSKLNLSIKSTNGKVEEDAISVKSIQSTETGSWTTIEQDNDDEEKLRQKEQHLQNLGLLTHKAAEKRRQEFIQTAAAVEASRAAAAAANQTNSKRNGGKSATSVSSSATSHEYTGTLKTVIKLNRNSSGVSTGTTTTLTATTASTSNGGGSSGSNTNSGNRKSNVTNTKDSGGVRRQSLKITFQKGRGRATHHGSDRNSTTHSTHGTDHNAHAEDSYYTIQNENEGAHKNSGGSSLATATAGTKDQQLRIQKQQNNNNNIKNNYNNQYNHNNNINNKSNHNNTSNVQTHGRKSYNSRSNTNTSSYNYNHHFTKNSTYIDSSHSEGHGDAHHQHHHHHATTSATGSHKKDDREEILIPEKASSFKFHPGRLCEDQCYYCSGKFGLYDTPCHVGQIKSVERQLKILKNEEKLTVDNCLCDACFRHVDRRANVPSYKKRLSGPGNSDNAATETHTDADGNVTNVAGDEATTSDVIRKCVVPDCLQNSAHSLRRKCIRKSVKKYLLNFDMPTGSPYIWLCQNHYDAVIQCSGCVLCKRRLGKNHMYHITSDTERLEKALTDMGIPVQLGIGTAVCKLCRYFANLLMKPPDSTKSQKAEFVKNYRKRLLQFHNIHDGSNEVSDVDDDENTATPSKAAKLNNEQRKSGSPGGASSSSSLICVNENALDDTNGSNIHEQSQTENDALLKYVEEETSNENSKSPSPGDSSATETNAKQNSRLKAILQSGGGGSGKGKKTTGSDLPSALLRSNPNLSMRELFQGEEDLGLQFKAPFGSSSSQRTPEGWTRVQTFLQYDEPTRRLWEELQKPYGNQSSFLRHLILLEKYYRNGDLVLSTNASSNASVYTQTVRQRLTSYDQGHCGGLETVVPVLVTPPGPSPAKEKTKSKEKEKESETKIPLVEINDDDEDDVVVETSKTRKEANKTNDGDDDDVIMQEIPPATSAEKSASKRRRRSNSVEKLTQQLSTNAVTIIARPKDPQQQQQQQLPTTSSGKLSGETFTQKRNDTLKLQASPSGSKTQGNNNSTNIASLVPLSNNSSISNAAVTSIPGSIASNNNAGNSRSILKSNLLGISGNKSVELLPITTQKSGTTITATTVNVPTAQQPTQIDNNQSNNTTLNTTGGITKQQKILEVANKLLGSQLEAVNKTQQQNNLLTSPPELVSLQRRIGSGPLPTLGHNNSSATTSTTASSTTASLINAKRAHLMPNRQLAKLPSNVVLLPDTLSSHERAESKSWRPTLMSVEDNQHLLNKNGPLYQTADGRRLPGLVQVQSGGKPFLISIFDYNRMCILRREKLLRDQMLKAGKHNKSQQQHHHHQQQQQQQQQQHQQRSGQHNSNVNKMNSGGGSSNSNSNNSANKQAQAAAAHQQLLQLMQFHSRHQQQQQQQQPNLKNSNGGSGAGSSRYSNIKPPLIPTSTSGGASGIMSVNTNPINNRLGGNNQPPPPPNFPMPLLANALTNVAAAAANPNINASLNNNPWLWSNFPDAHDLLRNGAGGPNKLPPLLPKTTTSTAPATITSKQLQQQQQLLMDNNLMSKIPKSLTVIPQSHMQHKLMGGQHHSNNNNNNNSSSGSKE